MVSGEGKVVKVEKGCVVSPTGVRSVKKSLLTHLFNIMEVKKVSQLTKMCSKLGSYSI